MNGKNANNKVNSWGLELATYNITFEWISGGKNKAANCLSHLLELPHTTSAVINMLSVSNTDEPTFNTRNHPNNTLHQIPPQHNQILHLKSHQHQTRHLNP